MVPQDPNSVFQPILTELWLSMDKLIEEVKLKPQERNKPSISRYGTSIKNQISALPTVSKSPEALGLVANTKQFLFFLVKCAKNDEDTPGNLDEMEENFAQHFETFYYTLYPLDEDELEEEIEFEIVSQDGRGRRGEDERRNGEGGVKGPGRPNIKPPRMGLGSVQRRTGPTKTRVPTMLLKNGWVTPKNIKSPGQQPTFQPIKETQKNQRMGNSSGRAEWKVPLKKAKSNRKPKIPMGTFRLTKKSPLDRRLSQFVQISTSPFDPVVYEHVKKLIMDGHEKKFLEAILGIDVNMQDPNDYNTLLHWAVAYNEVDMARALLQRGMKLIKNGLGMSPLDLAIQAFSSGDSSFWEMKNLLSGNDIEFLKI